MIQIIRMWNKKEKRMYDVCGFDLITGEIWDYENGFDIKDCILMQSIGLTDINGKEIFEGDVIKATYVNNIGVEVEAIKVLGVVYFNYGAYCVDGYYFKELNNLEVIGNKYENPEILEENK